MRVLPKPELHFLLWAVLGLEWSESAVKVALEGVRFSKGLDETFPKRIWQLLNEEDGEKKGRALIEAVLLLTNDDSPSRHNARAKLDRPFLNHTGTTESGRQWQTQRFLDFWMDLREALSAPAEPYRDGEILIVDDDDHPGTDFDVSYRAVAKHLLGNENAIKLVNPLYLEDKGYDAALFFFFTGYQTLRSLGTPEPTRLLENFRDIMKGVRFILVDQLFKLHGREDFFGAEMIRGLTRWLHDSRDGSSSEQKELPEIIALSRTDDPKVIQAALQAGAQDYVLKVTLRVASCRARTGQSRHVRPLRQSPPDLSRSLRPSEGNDRPPTERTYPTNSVPYWPSPSSWQRGRSAGSMVRTARSPAEDRFARSRRERDVEGVPCSCLACHAFAASLRE